MAESVEPQLFIILGGTGDLTKRKLLPALFHLRSYGELEKQNTLIVGAAQPEMSGEAYRLWAYESLNKSVARNAPDLRRWCDESLHYESVGRGEAEDYERLGKYIRQLEMTRNLPENRVFYLAMPPMAVPTAVEYLARACLLKSRGWVRVVFEKPFGHDFRSARALNTLLHRYLDESQIYRIDHYLGKETVQNLLAFRFANPIFES
jgi:glucose-6-phosphate 1-dehydrogenase